MTLTDSIHVKLGPFQMGIPRQANGTSFKALRQFLIYSSVTQLHVPPAQPDTENHHREWYSSRGQDPPTF
jgi:hypothetical protein